MDTNEYKKILIDKDVFGCVALKDNFVDSYDFISTIMQTGNIEESYIYEFEIINGKTVTENSLKNFLNSRIEKNDLKDWLYISRRLININKIQQSCGMTCCYCNDQSIPEIIGVKPEYEISSVTQIQKIKKMETLCCNNTRTY